VIVLHTTVASPTLASGTAIHVANGAVGITDTVITSHSLGINLLGGTAYEDYNLFFGVVVPTGGPVTSGPHHPAGDPRFVNPAGGNYHISRSSAALDQGIGVSVTSDFEGDPRPLRSGFDLGFDEYLNRAPVAVADSYATPQNTPLVVGNVQGVLANDADPNLEPLTSTLLSPPAAGLLSLHTDGGFVYTPSLNYSGVVTFTYRASDGELLSAASQVTVTVGPPHHLWLPLVRKP
jgi:hypothetical protein